MKKNEAIAVKLEEAEGALKATKRSLEVERLAYTSMAMSRAKDRAVGFLRRYEAAAEAVLAVRNEVRAEGCVESLSAPVHSPPTPTLL